MQGWRELRDVQTRSVHIIRDSQADLIVAASTAGGKTEAAFLPLISEVLDGDNEGDGFDLVYIGPLKALITDQASRLESICQDTGIVVTPWHGDVAASIKARAVRRPRGILLITPESLEALFIRRGLEVRRLFQKVRAVVLDELHTLLDSERGVQLRSLLTRLELDIGRPVRRVGLSATLGDMALARAYIRPDAKDDVQIVEARGGGAELQMQLRGYVGGDGDTSAPAPVDAISKHIFDRLRGSDNLVFAGSRQSVEIYADRLRSLCEQAHLPQEFYPHHASLSRDHRDFVERRLKSATLPTTAICTSTLELGIDIGDVACVAQIGAPFSVAALRQRLGRSGRRPGMPSILRQYVVETKIDPGSNFADRLRLGLVRSIAMIELLLEGWCEPPVSDALHLSTLVHQVLSVIAQKGGVQTSRLYDILCRAGPFRQVQPAMFLDLLRAMGGHEPSLVEQATDGLLLLGPEAERLVSHYSFYAVFQTPEEYRLISAGRELGTMPIENMVSPGMMLIFSGRRWTVTEVHDRDRVVMVRPSTAGIPPRFGGDIGNIHDVVIERMFALFERTDFPPYLDEVARVLLCEARDNFALMNFKAGSIAELGERVYAVATRCGTTKTTTLALALRSKGLSVHVHDGFLEVVEGEEGASLRDILVDFANGGHFDLFVSELNLASEKFHAYLTRALLQLDAASARLDEGCVGGLAGAILDGAPIPVSSTWRGALA